MVARISMGKVVVISSVVTVVVSDGNVSLIGEVGLVSAVPVGSVA